MKSTAGSSCADSLAPTVRHSAWPKSGGCWCVACCPCLLPPPVSPVSPRGNCMGVCCSVMAARRKGSGAAKGRLRGVATLGRG